MRRALPILLLAVMPAAARAELTERQLAQAVARPPANARLPGGSFEAVGRGPVTLAGVADGRPLVLVIADYTCRHVCGPGLALTAGALADTGLVAGRDYRLAVLGLDPKDSAADAVRMADAQMAGEPAVRRNAALLTGTPPTVDAATRALGYGHVYDPASDQFAHDASLYVFAPDGHLAALLPELGLAPAALRAAISSPANVPVVGADHVAHLCFGLGAVHGRYADAIVWGLRGAALAMLAGMGWWARQLGRSG